MENLDQARLRELGPFTSNPMQAKTLAEMTKAVECQIPSHQGERIFIELMTSDRKLKAS